MNTPHRLILSALAIALGALTVCATPALASPGLPDGRGYELVTSAEGPLADVYAPFAITANTFGAGNGDTPTSLPFQVAVDGEAIAYVGDPTVGGIGDGGGLRGNEYLATRDAEGNGWKQTTIQPPGRLDAYFEAFSPNLSVGILQSGDFQTPEAAPLSSEAPGEGYPDLYTYDLPEGGIYRPLFTLTPTEPASEFTAYNLPNNYPGTRSLLGYAGASEDLRALLFEAHGVLTPSAVDSPLENNLYVSVGGRLSLVNVLPNGAPEPNATFGAPSLYEPIVNPPDFSHVISSNGSRVLWSSLELIFNEYGEVVEQQPKALYMRENPQQHQSPVGECTVSNDACTVQIDAAVAGASGSSGGGRFWTASSDGSKVFFTDEHQLTEDSTAALEAPDLYEYEVGAADVGHLVDLTADPGGEHADVQGVLGASEDGSDIYFVAQGVLASNENSYEATAQPGGDNLYLLLPGGKPRFIATLSAVDDTHTIAPEGFNGQFGDWQPGLGHRTAEATPNGRSVVFESDSQTVGGYEPEVNGKKLEEIYVYDAEDDQLVCASCESNGEAPLENGESKRGLGAFLPPSWSYTYMPQWISEDGSRVFFDGTEPLVPQDTNGAQDVYEWEREGDGSCPEDRPEGCVYLLSSGVSKAASWFIGASSSGNDAFIVTRSQLTPEDGNEAYQLFDARVGGVQPISPPACSGTGCQGVPEPPPAFATPPSVTFEGVGNFTAPAPVVATKGKPKKVSRVPKCKRGQVRRGTKCVRKAKAKAKKSNLDRGTRR